MVEISMEWTDKGAVCLISGTDLIIICPRCDAALHDGVEHRCGDKALKPAKKRKASGRAAMGGE